MTIGSRLSASASEHEALYTKKVRGSNGAANGRIIQMFKYQSDHLPSFDPSGTKIVIAMIIFSIVAFLGGLFLGYYRDEIKTPPGNEHSVPAPRIS
jgi:hypothetical protein